MKFVHRGWALLALLFIVPGATAAINSDQAFRADYPFMDGLDGEVFTVVSGEAEVSIRDATGAFGFFDTTGFDIQGLERVCWTSPSPSCEEGELALRILPGGSVAMDFPGTVDGTYTADHALGLYVDFENDEDLNSYDISTTLLAPAVGGLMSFGTIRDIPFSSLFDLRSLGGLAGLDSATTVRLLEDGVPIRDFQGKDALVSFSGAPSVTDFRSDLVALPFERGSSTQWSPASGAAAADGLRLGRINELLQDLQAANQGNGGGTLEDPTQGYEDLERILSEVLNGAVLRLPIDSNRTIEDTFAVVRFDAMLVRAGTDDQLDWSGRGSLLIQNGQVAGAPNLVGPGFFALPIWSIILWVVAIGVWIARLVVKPPKENERWDKYRWIGWVFGAIAFIVLFLLWDFEVRQVWGTSLLSTDANGAGLGVTAAIQLAPLLFVLFAAAAPLRLLLRNGLLLGRQGTFMNLHIGVAFLLAYVMGATLLLAYIELILKAVVENLG
ncbi:MAG: hypothetical protein ACPHID_00870 [Thermoplasmatota archaeon]